MISSARDEESAGDAQSGYHAGSDSFKSEGMMLMLQNLQGLLVSGPDATGSQRHRVMEMRRALEMCRAGIRQGAMGCKSRLTDSAEISPSLHVKLPRVSGESLLLRHMAAQ